MGVCHATKDLTLPYFLMSAEPGDSALVVIEKAGHYWIAFVKGAGVKLPVVYDSRGPRTSTATCGGRATS
jgi:hypothetical protein